MTSMSHFTRDVLALAKGEGFPSPKLDRNRRHLRLTLCNAAGESRLVTLPSSPSDSYRGMLNVRADIRRAARELGVAKP